MRFGNSYGNKTLQIRLTDAEWWLLCSMEPDEKGDYPAHLQPFSDKCRRILIAHAEKELKTTISSAPENPVPRRWPVKPKPRAV